MPRAVWHTDLVVPDDDPFGKRVEEVGVPIRLFDDYADLNTRLVELFGQEKALYDAGIECAIKDRDDTSCFACPVSAHDDPRSALRPLCRTGREQEKVATEIAVAREAMKRGNRAGDE